jgi:hypothetical protein
MKTRNRRLLSLCLAAAASVSALLFTGGTASAAEVSASLVAALPKPACPAGTTPLTPASARVTPHGARVYHYAMEGGTGIDAFVPPTDFRPTEATDATLAEMNLPTRPSRATDLAGWQAEMAAYRGTEQPAFCRDSHPVSSPAGRKGRDLQATHWSSNNWSGYLDTQGGYTQVVAHWLQENAYNCGCGIYPYEVTWVGFGGWNTGNLLQAGTKDYGYSNPATYGWFEYLGAAGTVSIQTGGHTVIGTDVAAAVRYSGGVATFQVANQGTLVVNASVTGMAGDYDSSTAEFINERPTENGYLPPLTNYLSTQWYNARVYRGSTQINPGDSGVVGVVMTSDGSLQAPPCSSSPAIMAYPANLYQQSFTSYYCRSD